jgi:hypothetical protein
MALASEVIYREDNYEKILMFLAHVLKPGGVCILINKAYYFGVGGSVQGFKEYLKTYGGFTITKEIVLNDKKSNKRIIQII